METLRSFIALELGVELQQQLAKIQNELKKANADVKWARPEGIHLTLKFLGNVSPGLLEDIKKIIAHIAQQNSRFTMSISQLGAFPTLDHPRVIWVGLDQGKEQAVHLAKILEEKLQRFGFLSEKRSFKPHLTLGRVRSSRNRNQLKKIMQNITIPEQTIQIKTLTLFKSTLTPEGALYQPLLEAKLS